MLLKTPLLEEEVHIMLTEALNNQNYEVYNLHNSGAAVENGVDIRAEKSGESIVIAVKRKPGKKDLDQVKRLLSNRATKYIYTSTETPTAPFLNGIQEFIASKKLEYKDSGVLQKYLLDNKSSSFVERKLYDHQIFRLLEDIIEIWQSAREVKSNMADESDLYLMWKWKDKAVSFRKSIIVISAVTKNKISQITETKTGELETLIDEVHSLLDILIYELEELKTIYSEVHKTRPGILAAQWSICRIRSNWMHLSVPVERHPDQVSQALFRWIIRGVPKNMPYSAIMHFLDEMEHISKAFEDAIDWFFADSLENFSGTKRRMV